jgi:lysylphosphatidylglycerol synthetase-like protein (DUF2156 family)
MACPIQTILNYILPVIFLKIRKPTAIAISAAKIAAARGSAALIPVVASVEMAVKVFVYSMAAKAGTADITKQTTSAKNILIRFLIIFQLLSYIFTVMYLFSLNAMAKAPKTPAKNPANVNAS